MYTLRVFPLWAVGRSALSPRIVRFWSAGARSPPCSRAKRSICSIVCQSICLWLAHVARVSPCYSITHSRACHANQLSRDAASPDGNLKPITIQCRVQYHMSQAGRLNIVFDSRSRAPEAREVTTSVTSSSVSRILLEEPRAQRDERQVLSARVCRCRSEFRRQIQQALRDGCFDCGCQQDLKHSVLTFASMFLLIKPQTLFQCREQPALCG